MNKIKQYGISMPIDLYDKLNAKKKATWITSKRILKDAVNSYEFNINHKYKEFDTTLIKKNLVDIDMEKYKELNLLKIEHGLSVWFLILCAVDEFIK